MSTQASFPAVEKSGRQWSKYQLALFDDFARGTGHTVIEACAGSGKTTSIIEGLKYLPVGRKTIMLAFNRSTATELKSRVPPGVDAKTSHGLGYGAIMWAWRSQFPKIDVDERKEFKLAKHLVPNWSDEDRDALLKTVAFAKAWVVSSDKHLNGLMREYDIRASGVSQAEIVRRAQELLLQCMQPSETISFDDMVWLPVAAGLRPKQYDVVVTDELQDNSRAQVELSLMALRRDGRFIGVGDRHQCHPPGVMIRAGAGGRVEMAPIESLRNGDEVYGWDRNAQRMIGGMAVKVESRHFDGELCTATVAGRHVPMTPNHKVLSRWSDRLDTACVTYLMYRSDLGYRVGWCKLFSSKPGSATRAFHLAMRARIEKAEKVWILKVWSDRTDASVYESVIAGKYGIPTSTFEPVNGATHLTTESIQRIFGGVGPPHETRSVRCLADHGRYQDLPLYPFPLIPTRTETQRSRGTYFPVYACNIEPGMMSLPLPDATNSWAKVEAVTRTPYSGPVYSLDVAKDHSYAANGVVVLNSIYGFRGADSRSIPNIIKRLDAKTLPLSVTYRCPTAVVEHVREIVPQLEAAPGAPTGAVEAAETSRMLAEWQPGDFVLSRVNAPLVRLCLHALRAGKPAYVLGRDVGASLRALVERYKGGESVKGLVEYLREWRDAETERLRAAEKEKQIDTVIDRFETIVALAEGVGTVSELLARLEALFSDETTGRRVMFSSTHKAKGLEAKRVWMLAPTYRRGVSDEEDNLYYVAATRSLLHLFLVNYDPRASEV